MTTLSELEKNEKWVSDIKDINEMNFGSRLQRQRLNRKISIKDLADLTYISRDFLYALEDNKFEQLPAEAYTVGFIRTYCKFLDIESDEYVDEYRQYLKLMGNDSKNKKITDNMLILRQQNCHKFYIFVFAILLMFMGIGATVAFIYYQNFIQQGFTLQSPLQSPLQPPLQLQESGQTTANQVEIPSINSGLQPPDAHTNTQ